MTVSFKGLILNTNILEKDLFSSNDIDFAHDFKNDILILERDFS